MKAIVMEKDMGPVLRDLPVPAISKNDILVRMKACGLCGTDIEKIRGQYTASMPVLGHEPAGVIEDAGSEIGGLKVGDRVFAHHHVPCYSCYLCSHGSETMCDNYRTSNIYPGGFSELFRVPAWNIERGGVLRLPSNVSDEEASFIEPAACCLRALNRAGIKSGDSVLVVGAGPLGLIHSRLLEQRGARTIISDIREERLAMAERFGVKETLNSSTSDYVEKIKKSTNGRGVDFVITATGNPAAIAQSFRIIRKGGTVCLFGVPTKGSRLDYDISDIFNSEINICTNYAGTEKETNEVLGLMTNGHLHLSDLITHRFPLERFDEAINTTSEGSTMKVIITP